MDTIANVKYVDAFYVYSTEILSSQLSIHEAHGYFKENIDNYTLTFIQGIDKSLPKSLHDIIRGLIIPKSALLSNIQNFNGKLFENLKLGSTVEIIWEDIVYMENSDRKEVSLMETLGSIEMIGDEQIVVKSPNTKRIKPLPSKDHPEKKPTFYVIPKSLIQSITI